MVCYAGVVARWNPGRPMRWEGAAPKKLKEADLLARRLRLVLFERVRLDYTLCGGTADRVLGEDRHWSTETMVTEATAASELTFTGRVGKLFFTTVRFSGAATLYGVQQVESVLFKDGEGFSKQIKRLGTTVDSVSDCLAGDISAGKKDALESVSNATGSILRQSVEVMSILDPRQILRVANDMAQKSSESVSGWVNKKGAFTEESPRLAVDVLSN